MHDQLALRYRSPVRRRRVRPDVVQLPLRLQLVDRSVPGRFVGYVELRQVRSDVLDFDRQQLAQYQVRLGYVLRPVLRDRLHPRVGSLHQEHRHDVGRASSSLSFFFSALTTDLPLPPQTSNCGAVGTKCPTSYSNGSGSICSNSVCQPKSCSTGYAFDYSSKICRNILSDTSNCAFSSVPLCSTLETDFFLSFPL